MIHELQQSSFRKWACLFVALQLLNCSIGLAPKHSIMTNAINNLNYIDTAYELMVEEILGFDNAIPEYGEPLNSAGDFIKTLSLDKYVAQTFPTTKPFSIAEKKYFILFDSKCFDRDQETVSPPPKV